MKMCQECGLFPAEIRLTQIADIKSESSYLCTACARKRGIHIAEDIPDTQAALFESAENPECPGCLTTLSDFRGNGRLGCPDCYRTFDREIELLLKQVHGSSDYHGKKYRSVLTDNAPESGRSSRRPSGLSMLREALDAAVKKEDFERAAALRDAIDNFNSKEGKCA